MRLSSSARWSTENGWHPGAVSIDNFAARRNPAMAPSISRIAFEILSSRISPTANAPATSKQTECTSGQLAVRHLKVPTRDSQMRELYAPPP